MKIPTSVFRQIILPIGDFLFGQQMISRLKFLEKAQWWSREHVLERQEEDLQRLIKVAYDDVPFYRTLMDEKGIKPQEIRIRKDLSKLPVVSKDMLRSAYPDLCTRPTGQRTYQASTSGSTGKNFFVIEDAQTAGWYRSTFLLELEWAGWQVGVPHLQTGMTLDRSLDRKLKDWLFACHYESAYQLDDAHLDHMLQVLERHKLMFLWGYPGSLFYLARHAAKRGWNTPLNAVVSWGDTLYPHYRNMIETAFQTKVFDTYGCAEGFHIAGQCAYGSYHMHALDTIVEIVDDAGIRVAPGVPGNVVVTRLHPGPMPFIRYAVGDIAVISNEASCPCGRGFPILSSIQGRNADVITTPSGNRLIVHFFTGILEHFQQIDSFQVVQTSPNLITLRIVPEGQLPVETKNMIITALKEKGMQDMDINLEEVEEIALPPSGKHRFVINELPKE